MVLAGVVVVRVTPFGVISFVAALVALGGVALGAVTWRGARGRA
ncbi:MAG: hypothetical protein QOJ67_2748, partial [Acidimicrobiaceae bacterium]